MSPAMLAARARRRRIIAQNITPAVIAGIALALPGCWAGFWLAAAIARTIATGGAI
jgi:hypothetical protein